MNKFKEKNKGITLIVLVITIIILLILAGISIQSISGNNGIIKRANEAKDKYETSSITEQIEIAKASLASVEEKITAKNIKDTLVSEGTYKEDEIEIISKDEDTDTIKIKNTSVDIPVIKVTLYFEKSGEWTNANQIYAYVWKENDADNTEVYKPWPGVQTELVEGTDNIYKYTVPEKYEGTKIIFNNGKGLDITNGMQTIDLYMGKDGQIFKNNDAESRWIYIRNNWSTKNANIYMWNDSGEYKKWPGVQMEYIKSGGGYYYYKYELPQEYNKFKCVEITTAGTPSGTHQTNDLVFSGGNKIYGGSGNTKVYSDGIWEQYK